MAEGDPVPGSLFIYAPNQGAPIFFAIAFATSAIFHFWQCRRYHSLSLLGLHPLCAVLLTAGYTLREYASFNYLYSPRNLITYILSQVLIYICPPLLELSNYHILARTFAYIPHLSPLPPRHILTTFGALMAVIELLNALGVALAANPSSSQPNRSLGKDLILASLALQLTILLIFVALASIFHSRLVKSKFSTSTITTPLFTLYASTFLIFARCIFRLVEHTTGPTAVRLSDPESLKSLTPLLRYEWYFYVFEATLMLLNSVLWNVWNAGRYLKKGVCLDPDGREVQGEVDRRGVGRRIGSVVTFGVFFREKKGGRQFEELRELNGGN
ncbi:RTA1 like protein-domain-containing protein [Immersiella caudata]|uniref:RTA1 like protein-domain-containing protein n=1 Tax=Immersiella caudata TaxID=314043 RepID=A0AA40BX79_9PEZI|nr:RTA1 like protein-domain-containing protein [Immersiella caudata]